MGALILRFLHLCLSVTHVPPDKPKAYLTETQWHADAICAEFVCEASMWFLSCRAEWHIHHFHVRQGIWKAHSQEYGCINFHSFVHCQYVVCSYAYWWYANVLVRHWTAGAIHSPKAIRSWFCSSCLQRSVCVCVYTFPDSQHSSIAVQADVLSSDANSYDFRIWIRYPCRRRLQSDGNKQKLQSFSSFFSSSSARRHRESCERLWRDTVEATVRTGTSRRQQFPPPHLWCVVLSNGDARAGCWWPRRGTRIHTEAKKRHLLTKKALKVHQRTLFGLEKYFSVFVSPLLSFSLKLKWLKQLKDALSSGPLCPLRLQRCASSARAHVCWHHLHWW